MKGMEHVINSLACAAIDEVMNKVSPDYIERVGAIVDEAEMSKKDKGAEPLDEPKDASIPAVSEFLQKKRLFFTFTETRLGGPDHMPSFRVCLTVSDGNTFASSAGSIKHGKQMCAELAYDFYTTQ
jgi:hypothetical protein